MIVTALQLYVCALKNHKSHTQNGEKDKNIKQEKDSGWYYRHSLLRPRERRRNGRKVTPAPSSIVHFPLNQNRLLKGYSKDKIKHKIVIFYTDNLSYIKKKIYWLFFKNVAIIAIYPEHIPKQSHLGQAKGRRLRPQSDGCFRNIRRKGKQLLLTRLIKWFEIRF